MTDIKTEATVKPRIEPHLSIKEPPLFRVIYINDEVTTMQFVVESLVSIFDYEPEEANDLAQKVHQEGSGTAAILPYEMAEQKGVEVTQLARSNGFPLQIKLEPAE